RDADNRGSRPHPPVGVVHPVAAPPPSRAGGAAVALGHLGPPTETPRTTGTGNREPSRGVHTPPGRRMSPAPVTTVVDGHGPVIDFFDDPPGGRTRGKSPPTNDEHPRRRVVVSPPHAGTGGEKTGSSPGLGSLR